MSDISRTIDNILESFRNLSKLKESFGKIWSALEILSVPEFVALSSLIYIIVNVTLGSEILL